MLVPRAESEVSNSHFEVLAFVDGSNWKKTGLKSHDVVIKLDTKEINSAANFLQLFKIVEKEGLHTLYILRNKQQLQLKFHGPLYCHGRKSEINVKIISKIKSLGKNRSKQKN